ncbi:MAG: protein kinase [Planctomycetaceae bacterium]
MSSQHQVDELCDEFERLIRFGEKPAIEDFLNRVLEHRREDLLNGLLDVELEFSVEAGLRPSCVTYEARFPEYRDVVAQVFAARGKRVPSSDPLASTLNPSGVRRFSDTGAEQKSSRRIRCPECKADVSTLVGQKETTVSCASCGKSFRVRPRLPADSMPRNVTVPERIDRYEIRKTLGRGSFGAVYRAWDPRLEREVALKLPHPKFQDEPGFHDRFLREARALAGLQHPGICRIHEVHELHDGRLLLSLAFLDGKPLSKYFSADKPMKAQTAARLGSLIASALQSAHEAGILHRDLKPDNIMLIDRSRPVVTDFGLARRGDDAALTQTGQILGTPAYMSPEQATGRDRELTPATDIYSLGATLYHMVTGQRPFSGSISEVLAQVLRDEPRKPTDVVSELSSGWDDVLMRCLQKQPEERFKSMTQLAAALTRLADKSKFAEHQEARNAPKTQSRRRGNVHRNTLGSRRKWLIAGLATVGLAAVAAAAFSFLFPTGSNDSAGLGEVVARSDTDEQASPSPGPRNPEADSPMIGNWKIYGDHLPVTGAAIEFFPSGDIMLTVDDQTVGGADSTFPLRFETCRECEEISTSFQLHVPHGVPSVAGSRSTIAAAANSLGAFGLRDTETWCLNSMPSGSYSGWRNYFDPSVDFELEMNQSADQEVPSEAEQLGGIVLIRAEEDIGSPAVGPAIWLFGSWEVGAGQYIRFEADGGLIRSESGTISGGRMALGGVTEIYRVAQMDPRDGSVQIEVFRQGNEPGGSVEKSEHRIRSNNGIIHMTLTQNVVEERVRSVPVNRRLPDGQIVSETVEQTYTVTVPVTKEIEIRHTLWTSDAMVDAGADLQLPESAAPIPEPAVEVPAPATPAVSPPGKMTAKQMVEQAVDAGKSVVPAASEPVPASDNAPAPNSDKSGSFNVAPAPAQAQNNDKNTLIHRNSPVETPVDNVGPLRKVLSFNGTDAYVETTEVSFDSSGPFTVDILALVSAWQNSYFVSIGQDREQFSLLGFEDGSVMVSVSTGDGEASAKVGQLAAGKLMHLAAVWDGRRVVLFVDGNEVVSSHVGKSRHFNYPNQDGLFLGVRKLYDGRLLDFFKGQIHEVRVSKHAQYTENFTSTTRLSADEYTVALYRCDNESGDRLFDSSGNNHHGTLHRTEWISGVRSPVERVDGE